MHQTAIPHQMTNLGLICTIFVILALFINGVSSRAAKHKQGEKMYDSLNREAQCPPMMRICNWSKCGPKPNQLRHLSLGPRS
jgi:hypothetical protein